MSKNYVIIRDCQHGRLLKRGKVCTEAELKSWGGCVPESAKELGSSSAKDVLAAVKPGELLGNQERRLYITNLSKGKIDPTKMDTDELLRTVKAVTANVSRPVKQAKKKSKKEDIFEG